MRREDRGNTHDVACGNARVSQGQLETRQALPVLSNSLGEENLFRDKRHGWCRVAVPPKFEPEKWSARKLTSTCSDVNLFHVIQCEHRLRQYERNAARRPRIAERINFC